MFAVNLADLGPANQPGYCSSDLLERLPRIPKGPRGGIEAKETHKLFSKRPRRRKAATVVLLEVVPPESVGPGSTKSYDPPWKIVWSADLSFWILL